MAVRALGTLGEALREASSPDTPSAGIGCERPANEITCLAALLAPFDLTGVTVTADALHTQRAHTRFLVEDKKAYYLLVVTFVCQHGAAKSVIAAVHLRRLAAAAGLQVRPLARGTEPEPVMAPGAVAGLRTESLDLPSHEPLAVSESELASAWLVVSFGPGLDHLMHGPDRLEYWTDVPAVSDGFTAARDAIVVHVKQLTAEMAAAC